MTFSRTKPYDALPLLPPKCDIETSRVMRACVRASRALAELKGRVELLPDPSLLINTIPLQEAKFSSEIENIVTTQDKLYQAVVSNPDAVDAQTKEVLRYRAALRLAVEQVLERSFTLVLVRETCSKLMGQSMSFREPYEQVQLSNPNSSNVTYMPPSGGPVLIEKLQNLIDFMRGEGNMAKVDPLIRMAVSHYQFEAIHPFVDGNGRTGRILNLVLLVQERLLSLPVLYLSRFILKHKIEYYELLKAVTEQENWEDWLLYMLGAIETTAGWTIGRITAISELMTKTLEHGRIGLPKRVYSKELIELIFRQPYCKTAFVVEAGLAKRQTAASYLQALVDLGILESGEKHGRQVIYKHRALIDVLSI